MSQGFTKPLPIPLPANMGGTGLTAPGSSGNLLTSNGTAWVSSAPAAVPASNSKNLIIGGDFTTNPWQRGTSFTNPIQGTYTADRVNLLNTGTTAAVNILKSADAPTAAQAGVYCDSCITYDVTTADASIAAGDVYGMWYKVEGYDASFLGLGQAGSRNMTLSFWHKHTVTGTYSGSIMSANQSRSYPFEYTQAVTDTWEKAVITIPVDTTGTWLYDNGVGLSIFLMLAVGSTYAGTANAWTGTVNIFGSVNQVNALNSTSNFCKFALMQLEMGSSATTYQLEDRATVMSKCLRYYIRRTSSALQNIFIQSGMHNTAIALAVDTFAPMRTDPIFSWDGTAANWQLALNNTAIGIVSLTGIGTKNGGWITVANLGATAGFAAWLTSVNSSAWLAWSAEL